MKNINKLYPLLFLSVILAMVACDEEPTEDLRAIIKEDLGYVPKISQFRLITPATSPVPAQSNLAFDIRFWSEGDIDDIKFYQIVGVDTTLISELSYSPAYS